MRLDLTGLRFSRLVVVRFAFRNKHRCLVWECVCDCGNKTNVGSNELRRGNTRSCGCLQKETAREFNSLEAGISGCNRLWRQYQRNAAKAGKSFELTKEQFIVLTKQNCHYCGVEPKYIVASKSKMTEVGIKHSTYTYNGIDRLDSQLGYTLNNCVTCCGECNLAKRDMPLSQFLAWSLRLGQYQVAKQATILPSAFALDCAGSSLG